MDENYIDIQVIPTMKKVPRLDITEKTFGQRLANLRKVRGLAQKDFAQRLGISQRMVSYYENESRHPPAGLLPPIAKILKISIDELLGLKISKTESTPNSVRLWKRLRVIDQLPPKDQKAVIHYIEALLAKQRSQQ